MGNTQTIATHNKSASLNSPLRHYEFDWLRVLVILNLVPFHVAWLMTLVPEFSALSKGADSWWTLLYYITFFSSWHMPLLFFVAGASALSSLKRRSAKEYVVDRIKRLLIPLLFFMIFVFPIMVYFLPGASEVHSMSDYFQNFWLSCLGDFHYNWPENIRPVLPSWGHMWFVAYLLVVSLVTLPAILWLKKIKRGAWMTKVMENVTPWQVISILGIPFVMIIFVLAPRWPLFQRHDLIGDWTYFTYNFLAFGLGCAIGCQNRFEKVLCQQYWILLALAIILSVVVLWMRYHLPIFSTPAYTLEFLLYALLYGFNTWFWLLAALGLSKRFLSYSNGFLRYFSRVSYPWYILHLVVMVVIGYFVRQWGVGTVGEFLLICVLTASGTLFLYELLIVKTKTTRLLFGIK
jgi:peptidoglycan/LPS O-acetylase OafA/YrhL